MREGWQRETPAIPLDRPAIERLIRPAFPAARLRSFRPPPGGLANTNVTVLLWGGPKAVVIRLYQRDPAVAPKEAALNALVLRHGVPTARFLYAASTNEVTGGPYAIMEWIEGLRLRFCDPAADAQGDAEGGSRDGPGAGGDPWDRLCACRLSRRRASGPRACGSWPRGTSRLSAALPGRRHWRRASWPRFDSAAAGLCGARGRPARSLARPALPHPCGFQCRQHHGPAGPCAARRGARLGIRLQRQPGLRFRPSVAPASGPA